jgi:hypothetical protein
MTDAVGDRDPTAPATKTDLREVLSERKVEILKFIFGAMAAQTALIVTLIEFLK